MHILTRVHILCTNMHNVISEYYSHDRDTDHNIDILYKSVSSITTVICREL